ncbi:uncharacterized protein MONBRDRAFT_28782 [Monosiga brevicollis MX1]|uniref:Uncharacterized protein n=1 Tax=Monosiga brevicollis TaxID=81824 RepID=A9V963_MONBE|nr:uncharacterized protein MONBRDRAFT_28782 [Monosiga brevicollis MX1]EDQ86071.1 predicted protein [Monosiga brevicollis MX1]|eukprot:XP_001749265.1 hypothetical protein [Monosiga brevicollis MX1]
MKVLAVALALLALLALSLADVDLDQWQYDEPACRRACRTAFKNGELTRLDRDLCKAKCEVKSCRKNFCTTLSAKPQRLACREGCNNGYKLAKIGYTCEAECKTVFSDVDELVTCRQTCEQNKVDARFPELNDESEQVMDNVY